MDQVLVTGATGFIGANLVRLLLRDKRRVRVLVRPTADQRNLPIGRVEIAQGDLRDLPSLKRAVRNCQQIFHVAADYRFWAKDPSEIYASNVTGTKNLLVAAESEGVRKFVFTSTVGTLGLASQPRPGNEQTAALPDQFESHYKASKLAAEKLVMAFVARGLPAVVVNPSTPIGAWDRKPTPTGKIIVDFAKGRLPAYVETGLNFVDVEDVCRGHLLAARLGKIGERYILGSENLPMLRFLQLLAEATGRKAPRLRLPWQLAHFAGWASTTYASYISHQEPRIALEAVRMAKHTMYFNSEKAEKELGWTARPIGHAIGNAVSWFAQNGFMTLKNENLTPDRKRGDECLFQ